METHMNDFHKECTFLKGPQPLDQATKIADFGQGNKAS